MILRKKEAVILECIRQQKNFNEIAESTGIPRGTVVGLIARLSELSVIYRIKPGHYEVIVDSYEVIAEHGGPLPRGVPEGKLNIPDHIANYLRLNYHKKPRRELAKHLQLNKYTLNTMIIQLGMVKKESLYVE
jgi:hypothetical protein